jgi:hypothetical protein
VPLQRHQWALSVSDSFLYYVPCYLKSEIASLVLHDAVPFPKTWPYLRAYQSSFFI